MRLRFWFSMVVVSMASLLFVNCRTTNSGSTLRNIDTSATDGKCLPDLNWYDQNPVKRLSTPELEAHIRARVDAKQWECELNYSMTTAVLGLEVQDGEVPKAVLEREGGYFGGLVALPTSQGSAMVPINDNSMRYMWSLDGAKGEFLPRDKWFNHIIPLRRGGDQPELRRFLKDGDIIVYFDAKSRLPQLDTYNQFRSGHSATITEFTDDSGKTQFMLIDTPSSYARPIAGYDSSPFHVYRMVPRDDAGNSIPEEEANAYRAQIARWGALALAKFPFEGDYDSLSFKSASQIDTYAKSYLAAQFSEFDASSNKIVPMYCAWYSFQNMTLGYMRPMNQSGLASIQYDPPGQTPKPFFDHLMTGPNGYKFDLASSGVLYSSTEFKTKFKAPDELKPHDQMLFEPITAPELLMNFLDRTIGPDAWVPADRWAEHAMLKVGVLEGGMSQFLQLFTTAPNPNMPASLNVDPAEYATYNNALSTLFKGIVDLYKESLGLQGDVLASKRLEITSKTFELVRRERLKPVIPRKWVPPYIYTREAEAFESLYRPAVNGRPYRPRMVYVGTVMPQGLLKEPGAAESAVLRAIPSVDPVMEDFTAHEELKKYLESTGRLGPAYKDMGDAFLMELHKSCMGKDQRTCDGLNEFEMSVLLAMRGHWRPDTEGLDADLISQHISGHNTFGLDDVLFKRTLISYWNNPADFRAAIYEGDASTLESAVTNLRIIMSVPPSKFKSEADRIKPSQVTTGHPRRVTPMKCSAMDATEVNVNNQKCAPFTTYYY